MVRRPNPRVCCQHVLQRSSVQALSPAGGEVVLRTPFIYTEAQGQEQIMLTGIFSHRLLPTQGGWEILQKRVDLLNSGQPLPAIQLFI